MTSTVTDIDTIGGVSHLRGARVRVDEVPDVEAAQRLRRTMRRIHSVEIDVAGGQVSCQLTGLGHRLPVTRRVPLRIALGLAEIGVPLVVRN